MAAQASRPSEPLMSSRGQRSGMCSQVRPAQSKPGVDGGGHAACGATGYACVRGVSPNAGIALRGGTPPAHYHPCAPLFLLHSLLFCASPPPLPAFPLRHAKLTMRAMSCPPPLPPPPSISRQRDCQSAFSKGVSTGMKRGFHPNDRLHTIQGHAHAPRQQP